VHAPLGPNSAAIGGWLLQDDEVRRLEDVIRRFRRLQVRDAIRRSRVREGMELIGGFVTVFALFVASLWLLFSFFFFLGALIGVYRETLLLHAAMTFLLLLVYPTALFIGRRAKARDPKRRVLSWRSELVRWSKYSGCAVLYSLPAVPMLLFWEMGIPASPSIMYWSFVGLLVAAFVYGSRNWQRKRAYAAVWIVSVIASFAGPIAFTIADGFFVFWSLPSTEAVQPTKSCPNEALFAHISDIHAVNEGALKTFQGNIPGNFHLPALLSDISHSSPKYLLVSGDITDTGRSEQWEVVQSVFHQHVPTVKIVMAPGNHDIGGFFGNWSIIPFLKSQDFFLPQIQMATGAPLHDAFVKDPYLTKEHHDAIEVLADCKICSMTVLNDHTMQSYWQCMDQCHKLHKREVEIVDHAIEYWRQAQRSAFPLKIIDEENGIAIFSLWFQEVEFPPKLGTNARAYLDKSQASKLKAMVESIPISIKTVVILEHYPVARGPGDFMAPPKFSANSVWGALLNFRDTWDEFQDSEWWAYSTLIWHEGAAIETLHWLSQRADNDNERSYFWLYGHRHVRSFSSIGKLTLAEAPNVSSKDGGFYLGTKVASGRTSISWCPRGRQVAP
jgi:predicted MPP superfamily phosphohydrolase